MNNRNILTPVLFCLMISSVSQGSVKKLYSFSVKDILEGPVPNVVFIPLCLLSIFSRIELFRFWKEEKELENRRKKKQLLLENRRKKKQLLYVHEKEILEEGEDHKFDHRPLALSGKIEENFGLYNEKQVAYLLAFYQRHENLLEEIRLKNNISDEVWSDFLKKREGYNRYIWKNIYKKKHENSAQWDSMNQETKEYIEDILKTAHIEPNSMKIKIKHKDLEHPGETQHEIYKDISNKNFYHIEYPLILLKNIPFKEFNDKTVLIHECGHMYLCHSSNKILLYNIQSEQNLEKLEEIEADCILPILNKKYAKIFLTTYVECCKVTSEHFKILKEDSQKFQEIQNTRPHTQPRGVHPSYFEGLMHICGVCRDVWDINISKAIAKIIPDKTEHEIFMASLINIDPTNKYYLPLVNVDNFELQVDRIKINQDYQDFNFIPYKRKTT